MESRNIKKYDGFDGLKTKIKNNGYSFNKFLASFKNDNNMAPNSTVQQHEQDMPYRQMSSDPLMKIARELAFDIVHYMANNRKHMTYTNKHAKTMRRTVDEICERHDILFNGMMKKLHITKNNAKETFKNVIEELFNDNQYNWGRIVVVYAFGGRLAQFCVDSNMPDYVDTVGEIVGSYVMNNLGSWIREQGGWVCIFSLYFRDHINEEFFILLLLH